MRFLTVVLTITGVLGTSFSQGDGLLNSYISGAESITPSAKGYLATFAASLDPSEVPLTPEDYALIMPKLADPQAMHRLLIDHAVAVELQGLSLPHDEAETALLAFADRLKAAIAQRIRTSVNYKTSQPTPKEAAQRIRAALDRLATVDDLEDRLLNQTRRHLASTPHLADRIPLLITWLPDVFETDVLHYVAFYVSEADAYKPTIAITLRKVFHAIQAQYHIFPQDYYTTLVDATPLPQIMYYEG